jgi:DNA-binding Xre family transcriptional regulator
MVKYNGNISDITLMIKHIMLDMDIKQKDLCNATGWTKATISNLLNNRTENPSLKILLELCNAMNCDLNIDIVPRAKEDS